MAVRAIRIDADREPIIFEKRFSSFLLGSIREQRTVGNGKKKEKEKEDLLN